MNRLNQLSNVTRSGALTVAGTMSGDAPSVTVNGSTAALRDGWYVRGGQMRRRLAVDYELDRLSVPLVTAMTSGR